MAAPVIKKTVYSEFEIEQLHILITRRRLANRTDQKKIRDIMRKTYGFYGRDHWNIIDLDHHHLDNLIATGQITVIPSGSHSFTTSSSIRKKPLIVKESTEVAIDVVNLNMKEVLAKFSKLNPLVDDMCSLPRHAGNYIICLKPDSSLPKTSPFPRYSTFQGLNVIYTGISTNLYGRDFMQHFEGNDASWSTLRKSLGVLFKYQLVPRISKKNPTKFTNKWRFSDTDEASLSSWMKKNLLLFYLPTDSYVVLELQIINYFDPPLNLSKANGNNDEFRLFLSQLRKSPKVSIL